MKAHIERMIKHEYWANQRLLQAIEQLSWVPVKAKEIFDHVIAANATWYARVTESNASIPIWRSNLETKDYGNLLNEYHTKWMECLALEADDLERTIVYHNSSGKQFSNPLHEIITHLCLHSQYHRGQIINLIRDQVDEIPSTDFIVYLRESSFMG